MAVVFYDLMGPSPHEPLARVSLDAAGCVVFEGEPGIVRLASEPAGFWPDLVEPSAGAAFLDALLARFGHGTGIRAVREP